jgi:hypothetical protein
VYVGIRRGEDVSSHSEEHKMKIYLRASSGEHGDIHAAQITIGKAQAELILKRRNALLKLREQDEDATKITFEDGLCEFLGWDHEKAEEKFGDNSFFVGEVESEKEPEVPPEMSDTMYLGIHVDSFFWYGYERYSKDSGYVSTYDIPYNVIEPALGEKTDG